MVRIPIELGMNKFCNDCGKCNNVLLGKLESSPVCEQCGKPLTITDEDRFVGGLMYVQAIANGENVFIG